MSSAPHWGMARPTPSAESIACGASGRAGVKDECGECVD